MTDKNKPMTEREITDKYLGMKKEPVSIEYIVRDARIGYLLADRAIEVPEVGEWPERATHADLCFSRQVNGCEFIERRLSIPRPVPAWFVPNNGDAVFFMYNDCLMVGKVKEHHRNGLDVECNGEIFPCSDNGVKKFDPAKIGLPWEEI